MVLIRVYKRAAWLLGTSQVFQHLLNQVQTKTSARFTVALIRGCCAGPCHAELLSELK